MSCPKRGTENAVAAAFCEECGAVQVRVRSTCGGKVSPGAKFCPSCGAALSWESQAGVPPWPALAAIEPVPRPFAGGRYRVSSVLKELIESRGGAKFSSAREVELKGLAGTHRVCEVLWQHDERETRPNAG